MYAIPAGDKLHMLCAYIYEKTGARLNPDMSQGFAILSDTNEFIAAVVVSNVRYYDGKPIDCEISCASESGVAWRPHVCTAIFQYIFGQLGCVRCTSITRKNNTKSREFLEALNFELEGKVRKGYDGEKDALVYGLLREECRYFPGVLNG